MDQPHRMRALLVPLDPTPAQEQLLRSYCGASRFAYNWTVAIAKENQERRDEERQSGIKEADLTKLSWSAWSMTPLWNSVKYEVAPWHRNVTWHAFCSGVTNASIALKNYDESKKGKRKGEPVGFPNFKNRHSKQSFTLISITRSGPWFSELQACSPHSASFRHGPSNNSAPRATAVASHYRESSWTQEESGVRRLDCSVSDDLI